MKGESVFPKGKTLGQYYETKMQYIFNYCFAFRPGHQCACGGECVDGPVPL